ncbi:MAG TPA: hypothetical protein VHZ75_08990 [Solirubrobacteraceae bacterium]|jgi:hypothetical protein|nr:hypothetical protein [Solirubrobacteraceae bacterium]
MERNDDDPDFPTRQERAAAAEARAIGGPPADVGGADTSETIDEAMRPVYEAGGGDAEGFELAEHDLVRNASHDDGGGYPERDGFSPERESDLSGAEFGEADDEQPPDR